ncbi:MAG: hypothetical protein ACOY5U_12045 [Pseudomonadota bacterium]
MTRISTLRHLLITAVTLAAFPAAAHDGGFTAAEGNAPPPFDIVHARIVQNGSVLSFHMAVSGRAGESRPAPTGALAGSGVFSYVWPTTLGTATVGFEPGAGILALAVTAHPDFDDTPLFDENGDGDRRNDGDLWHSHWVVLGPDDACGPGALKVVDIPEGTSPALPVTWPGLPLLIDSPGWNPVLDGGSVEVLVPFANSGALEDLRFDGVTAGLRINASAHAPLLCVVDVFDIASGDLSLPGRLEK